MMRLASIRAVTLGLGDESADEFQTTTMAKALRAEAVRSSIEPTSELFAAVMDPSSPDVSSLSESQRTRCHRLDSLARDIYGSWLVRGLDDQPEPSPAELSLRLARRERFKASLASRCDEIVLQGILTRAQARYWRTTKKRPPERPLEWRYGSSPIAGEFRGHSAVELAESLTSRASQVPSRTGLYRDMIGSDAPRALKLSTKQRMLAERVADLSRELFQAWLLDGLDADRLPPAFVLADRLTQRGHQLQQSIVAHAEVIALGGILTAAQAELVLVSYWRRAGPYALVDPELARRLRLTPEQRVEVLARLELKRDMVEQFSQAEETLPAPIRGRRPEISTQRERIFREMRSRMAAADEFVWDVLDPSQAPRLREILAIADSSRTGTPSDKRKRSK